MNAFDSNPLFRLKEDLEHAQSNAALMHSKMKAFELRLSNLDDKMRPVQTATESLSRAKGNIADTVLEIEKTHDFFRISVSCQGTIANGIKGSYSEFFDAIERLTNARKFFVIHREIKSSGSAVITIDGLLKKAVGICLNEIESLIEECGDAIEYVGGECHGVNPMDEGVAQNFHDICRTLNNNVESDLRYFGVYSQARIVNVKKLLSNLLESSSVADTGKQVKQEVPFLRGAHPFTKFYALAVEILKGEHAMWGRAFPNDSSDESMRCVVSICDCIITELSHFLVPLTVSAATQNVAILQQSNTFLVRLELTDIFLSKYDEIRDLCLAGSDSRTPNSAVKALSDLRVKLVEACLGGVGELLASALNGQTTFLGGQENSCDLHPVTGHVLHCCKELTGFKTIYSKLHIISRDSDISVSSSTPSSLQGLIVALLYNLMQCLEGKCAKFPKYKNPKLLEKSALAGLNIGGHSMFESGENEAVERLLPARAHLFMLNNLYSIHLYLADKKATGAAADAAGNVPAISGQMLTFTATVKDRLADETQIFLSFILRTLVLSSEDMKFCNSVEDKTSKHKMLKAMFSAFNGGMAAIISQQPEWRVCYADLRNDLDAQLLETVMPKYNQFYDTNSKIKFSTKHMDQYVKFVPLDVETALTGYFQRLVM